MSARSTVICPSCGAPLRYGATACEQCHLPLTGPDAARLWEVDQQLAALQHERTDLLTRLRNNVGREPDGSAAAAPESAPGPPARGRPSWSAQQTLLAGGVALVLVAAAVFLAVTWSLMGVAGQVAVMLVVTFASAVASLALARRGLRATAESVAVMALGLAALDAYAARSLDLVGLAAVNGFGYLTGSAAAIAAGSALLARLPVAVRGYAYGALLAAAVVPAAAISAVSSPPPSLTVAVLAAAGVAFAAVHDRTARGSKINRLRAATLPLLAATISLVYLLSALQLGISTVFDSAVLGQGGLAALLLLVLAGGAVWRLAGPTGLLVGSALAAVTLVGVAWHGDLAGLSTLVLLAAAAAAGASLLRERRVPTTALPRVPRRMATVSALTGHLAAGAGVVAVALADLAVLPLEDLRPLAGLVLATGAAAAVTAAAAREPWIRAAAAGYAALLAVFAAAVATLEPSGAATTTTVAAVIVTSVVAAAVSAWRHGHSEELTLAGAAALGMMLAVSAASGLDTVLPLSAALAVAGLAALAYALLPDRGPVAVAGVLGCSAATWVLSVDAGITVVEAYSLPLAALAGLVGAVHLVREPDAPSWTTVGPALSAGLLPSALATIGEPALTRPLAVLAVASLVIAAGTRLRWQSPVVVGTLASVVVAVSQLAPYAEGLPRYLSLGTAGVLLLVLGARYEQRRREAQRAAAWVRALH
ncbi:MAG TPA: hypothetical protein VF728_08975 [Nocardioides sp.]